MTTRQVISVGNLRLDLENYRHGKLPTQKAAVDAIVANQKKKLVRLAEDIVQHGLSPIESLLVVDAEDGSGDYIVIEGNRRLTAVKLMLNPDLALGDALIHKNFKRLNRDHADAIPKVFDCVIAPSKKSGAVWINRKHAPGLKGAGIEQWESVARARAEADQGIPHPELDAVDFVLTGKNLEPDIRLALEGSAFNITTLLKLVTTKEMQMALGLSIHEGKLKSTENEKWVQAVLADVMKIIVTGQHDGKKFTERQVNESEKRKAFIESVVVHHPKQKKPAHPWMVAGQKAIEPKLAPKPKPTTQLTPTPTTDDRPNLIPSKFKLELPSGKINDAFDELKKLDVTRYRIAVSVLFRVFLEISLESFMKKNQISLKSDKSGHPIDSFKARLAQVMEYMKTSKLMTDHELQPIRIATSDKNSLLAPETLHGYVHGIWLNPEPQRLKIAWNDVQLFVERLWAKN